MSDPLVLRSVSDRVARIVVNRPDKLNALNRQVLGELRSAVEAAAANADVLAIVLAGAGAKAFVAGADIGEMAALAPAAARQFADEGHAIGRAIDRAGKPVIAAVQGYALGGGCELALHCDIILAAENAKLALREVTIGIMPGAGGTQRFLRAAGSYKAARYLMTGDMMSAQVASEIGLVSEIVPTDQLMERALALAVQIAGLPQLAVHSIKEAIQLGADAPLQTALALERKSFQLLFASDDREEGMGAFLEKRPPDFKGR